MRIVVLHIPMMPVVLLSNAAVHANGFGYVLINFLARNMAYGYWLTMCVGQENAG